MSDPNKQLGGTPRYELGLPAIAPAWPDDEPSVHFLSREPIREGLQAVSDGISGYYDQLTSQGWTVEEEIRGATGKGIMVAAAKCGGGDTAGIDPQLGHPLSGSHYAVFACMLNELDEPTPDGGLLATTPRFLEDVPQTRGLVLGFKTSSGTMVHVERGLDGRWTIGGSPVVSFVDAAFGRRRTEIAQASLSWLRPQVERLGDRGREYLQARLDALHAHPEWIDEPGPVLPDYEEYLARHRELLPYPTRDIADEARSVRNVIARYMELHSIVDPDERGALNRALMPEAPITQPPNRSAMSAEAYGPAHRAFIDSYYKKIDVDLENGREGVLARVLSNHRRGLTGSGGE
ncbi:MAG TPA: hypothetical protein VLE99_04865 [Candidatus Saccharimonadales bacterium]|nr:hypothetical protein [Candidatus Saccharimonadales bacterium]